MSLGGLDWDRALAELVAERVQQAHGVDVWTDPVSQAILLDSCEKAKRHLSRANSYSVIADAAGHQVDVTVGEFEDRTRDLLLQTQMLVERVLEDAEKQHGLPKDRIDVMLTGGSSRMPMVKKMLEAVTGRPPLMYRNPELLVTIGAAYWAHLLQAGASVSVPVPAPGGGTTTAVVSVDSKGLVEVSAYPVGIEVLRDDGSGKFERFNSVVIPRGAKYGEEFTKEFRTAEENMTEITVVLYKGESGKLDECERLVEFTITGLPPNRPKGQAVRVTLGYDDSGIIRGRAVDVSTKREVQILVDRSKE
jgi:molecular chaperone DnaK